MEVLPANNMLAKQRNTKNTKLKSLKERVAENGQNWAKIASLLLKMRENTLSIAETAQHALRQKISREILLALTLYSSPVAGLLPMVYCLLIRKGCHRKPWLAVQPQSAIKISTQPIPQLVFHPRQNRKCPFILY
jgi:hypothetical protein